MTFSSNSVISKQSSQVQELCEQFQKQYTTKNSVQLRSEWGKMLKSIQQSDLNPISASGNEIKGDNAVEITFGAICRELGVPRSTAYHYIDEYITVSTYPEAIQEAAREANLNLSLPHVRAAYAAGEGEFPAKPSALEAAGIVAKLKTVKPERDETKAGLTPAQRFTRMLTDALDYAVEHKLIDKFDEAVVELQSSDLEKLAKLTELLTSVRTTA